jgi:hypothetical protein
MNEVTLHLASRWKRLGGAFIDFLISMPIIMAILMVTGMFDRVFAKKAISLDQRIILWIIGWAVSLILNGYVLFKG